VSVVYGSGPAITKVTFYKQLSTSSSLIGRGARVCTCWCGCVACRECGRVVTVRKAGWVVGMLSTAGAWKGPATATRRRWGLSVCHGPRRPCGSSMSLALVATHSPVWQVL
jgi:hypothetical protein